MNRAPSRGSGRFSLMFPIICVFFCGLFFLLAQAQDAVLDTDFLIRNWDGSGGLSGAAITSMTQTPDGYLWLGTRNGLARFDGVHFHLFDLTRTSSLTTNRVTSLFTDRQGNLWVGTGDGLIKVLRDDFNLSAAQLVGRNWQVLALNEDEHSRVWAAVAGIGLIGVFTNQPRQTNQIVLGADTGLVQGTAKNLWLVSGGNVWRLQTNQWIKLEASLLPGAGTVTAAGPAADGGLWYAVGQRIQKLNEPPAIVAGSADLRKPLPSLASALFEDAAGRVWAGTRGGGVFFYTPDQVLHRATASRARLMGGITSMFGDAQGAVWVGMSLGRVQQIRPRHLTDWPLPAAARESVPHTVCVRRDGSVWVGTDGAGVFSLQNGIFQPVNNPGRPDASTVVAILEDRQTNLWVGTQGGLFYFNEAREKLERFQRISESVVSALFEDRNGNLWVGGRGRLNRVRPDGVDVYEFTNKLDSAQQYEIRAIAEDAAGKIWLGTRRSGLFELRDGSLQHCNFFQPSSVTALHADADGSLWIGTMNGGLFHWQDGHINQWNLADGLPDNTVFAIIEDAADTLWISSGDGIFGLNKHALAHYNKTNGLSLLPMRLAREDGLLDNSCLGSGQPAATKSADGRIWFPTEKGIVSFQPEFFYPSLRQQALPVTEGVVVDGVPCIVARNNSLHISADARRFEFHFTAPVLDAPSLLQLRYRLEGLDESWEDAGQEREARYGRLPPGRYCFRVLAGKGGEWTESPHPLELQIVPRFWERGIFKLAASFALLGMVVAVVRLVERARARRKRHELELKQAMEQERARIAKDLHDDIGTGLTEVIFLSELAESGDVNPAEMPSHLANITGKTRQLAVAMDEAVWTANPKNDTLPNLAGYIADFAREFLRPTPVRCRLDISDNLPSIAMSATQRHNLLLAVKEALNNVVKHSAATEVWIRLHWEADILEIHVEDNGHGMVANPAGIAGDGSENMKARLSALGGLVHIQNQPGQGLFVCFTLPCGKHV
jgi:ligand-binding sensor domain-containing protein/signal transduction histidine kinase